MALEMWHWQRPRIRLCHHLIYQATREHLWSLPQTHCHNPELKLPLNLSDPPRLLWVSRSCWQGIPTAASWDAPVRCPVPRHCCDQHFTLHLLRGTSFTYLEKRPACGKTQGASSKTFYDLAKGTYSHQNSFNENIMNSPGSWLFYYKYFQWRC